MQRHQTSGRWQLGLSLSVLTTVLWGVLPTALSILLQELDGYTITWFRFLLAGAVLMLYLGWQRDLPGQKSGWQEWRSLRLSWQEWGLWAIATLCIGLDYILFLGGIAGTSPANAEILAQLAPVLMGLGAIAFFKERFTSVQRLGLVILTAGFALFFHDKLQVLSAVSASYWRGNGLTVLASLVWAIYALTQKQLLQRLSSSLTTLVMYLICALVLAPLAHPQALLQLDGLHLGLLLFCSLNTLISFGAFAESLNHWEASKISAICALTPVFTLLSVVLLSHWVPALVSPEPLTALGLLGALIVTGGSVLIAGGSAPDLDDVGGDR